MIRVSNALKLVVAGALCGLPVGCKKPAPTPVRGKPVVSVARPVHRMVTDALEYTGYLSADRTVQLRAQVRGYLQDTLYTPRSLVKAGTKLFQIDPRPFQAEVDKAEADVTLAKAQYDLAVAKLTRMENSLKANAISEVQVIEQRAERDKAKAEIDSCVAQLQAAKLNLAYTTITAPFDGIVDRDLPQAGALIDPQQTVMTTITDDSTVYVYFNVSESDLLRLRKGREELGEAPSVKIPPVPVFIGLGDETGYPHEGVLDYAAAAVDRSTGTIEVRGVFKNTDRRLIAGLFVRVWLPVSEPKRSLMVAERAIGIDQGRRYLFTVDASNKIVYRPFRGGLLRDGLRVIEDGIGEDDWVVGIGLQRVRPGVEVDPQRVSMESVLAPAARLAAATKPAASSSAPSPAGH